MITSVGVQHSGVFIPEMWSGKLQMKYYEGSVVPQITNTNWEGEIAGKGKGDVIHIRTVPDGTIRKYDKNGTIIYENLAGDLVDLEITQADYFAARIDDIDRYQSDIPLMDKWAEGYSEKMKLQIDTAVLGSIYADVALKNQGGAAGLKTSDINLGTDGAPFVPTKDNILDYILSMAEVLDQQAVPEQGRWLLITPRMRRLILNSLISDASFSGDTASSLRTGRVGIIDRFTLYTCNHLAKVGANTKIMAGHTDAITFAMQINDVKHIPVLESTFGSAIRGMQVYGYEAVKPEAFVVGTSTL